MSTLTSALAQELRAKTRQFDLDDVHDELAANAAECLAMVVEGEDDYSAVGNTRFGGDPDLPEGMAWPATGDPDDPDTLLSNFICQINFADIPRIDAGTPLPVSGILYVFVRSLESAYSPLELDTIYHAGGVEGLSRRETPDIDRLADEYLTELSPVRVRAEPAVSIAWYRKALRKFVGDHTDDPFAFYHLEAALRKEGQIGQLLGLARSRDERDNLYRKMYFSHIGRTDLYYNDYWDSLEEYQEAIDSYRDTGYKEFAEKYEMMRPGVLWLMENRASIAKSVEEWRLLLRVDSNEAMGLNILDADPLYVFAKDADLLARNFRDLAGQVTQG